MSWFAAAAAAIGVCVCSPVVAAQDAPAGPGSHELWAGVDAGSHNWLAYTGATYAPFSGIHEDGLRFRSTGGYGQYDFEITHGSSRTTRRIEAVKTYADVMIGYQARYGELTAKAFGGYAGLQTQLNSGDRRLGLSTGFKGALELWLNLGPDAWAAADVSYAQPGETASARLRTGYRVIPTLSLGAEGVLNHAKLYNTVYERRINDGRLGLFTRYEWFGGEISASAGIATPLDETDLLRASSAYGTMNWIVQF